MIPTDAATRGHITQLLRQWSEGDREAIDEVMPLVYDVLRRIAVSYSRRERSDHTLQATAIVNEAYLELVDQDRVRWQSRAHFIGFFARVMRRVLVDHARDRGYAKRGGRLRKVTLAEAAVLATERTPDLAALDDALNGLAEMDSRKARLVELRFFGGLTIEEAAEVLGISRATAIREWQRARAWLYRELTPASDEA